MWSFFLKEKSDLASMILVVVKNLNTKHNMQVQHLHCVNEGKNVAIKKAHKQELLGMYFVFTTHATSQQNG